MRELIIKILTDYVKSHNVIHVGSVIIELFADELIKHGAIFPVHCHECKHRTEDGFCHKDIATPGYKKTHIFGYCDKGEKI